MPAPATTATTATIHTGPVQHVLLVGHGTLGDCFIRAFTSLSFQARIRTFLLVRPATRSSPTSAAKLADYQSSGVTLLVGDINDRPALVDAMRSAAISAVVSAVGHSAHLDQLSLLEAVKAAGVRRFIPSEFGFDEGAMDVERSPLSSLLHNKWRVRDAMRDSGVDWTVALVGAFLEWFVDSDFFGLSLATNSITAPAALTAAITLTSLRDIGLLTAQIVLDDSTRNSVVRLGLPITYGEADTVDSARSNTQSPQRPPMERLVKRIEERQKELEVNAANLPARFAILLAEQVGISWPEEQTYSHQRGYRQRTFRQAIEEHVSLENV